MIDLEREAVEALSRCSLQAYSQAKGFVHDLARLPKDHKLTDGQALYLWQLVYRYRRQVSSQALREYGEAARNSGKLPDIYQEGDHRPGRVRVRPTPALKKTRYEEELERGGGKLQL